MYVCNSNLDCTLKTPIHLFHINPVSSLANRAQRYGLPGYHRYYCCDYFETQSVLAHIGRSGDRLFLHKKTNVWGTERTCIWSQKQNKTNTEITEMDYLVVLVSESLQSVKCPTTNISFDIGAQTHAFALAGWFQPETTLSSFRGRSGKCIHHHLWGSICSVQTNQHKHTFQRQHIVRQPKQYLVLGNHAIPALVRASNRVYFTLM